MKNIFTLILILTALNVQLQSQTWENTNVILKNPNSYPYGFNINLTYATGNWAREYSFSHSGTGKLFSIGALGSGNQLSYGYIGGNSTNHVVYDTPWMVFKSDGKVGIGTKDPKGNLHVQNTNLSAIDIQRHTDNSHWRISTGNFGTDALFIHPVLNNENIVFANKDRVAHMTVTYNGKVGIGTSTPAYKLDVLGTIRAREIKVDLNGADFVFEDDYQLRSLEEVEAFVKENKHLPEIAPAAEMQQNGTDLGALNNQFLQKIEELTLYLIEQEKTNKKQQELLESQQDLIQQQAVELEKLSKKLNNIQ